MWKGRHLSREQSPRGPRARPGTPLLDAGMSAWRGPARSVILKIASAGCRRGPPVLYLAVPFRPEAVSVPSPLRDFVMRALEAGEMNYPPSDGMLTPRAVVVGRSGHGVVLPVDSRLDYGRGRPAIYALSLSADPGDTVLYLGAQLEQRLIRGMLSARTDRVGAHGARLQPTPRSSSSPSAAKLLCLCSPGNPTGTVAARDRRSILEAVCGERTRGVRGGAATVRAA
jgi:aspartate aminotransferase